MTYLDTNIIIYLLEKHDIYSELVAQTLEELSENNGSFITSTITITEFLAGTTSSDLSTLHRIPKLTFILLEEEVAVTIRSSIKSSQTLSPSDSYKFGSNLSNNAIPSYPLSSFSASLAATHRLINRHKQYERSRIRLLFVLFVLVTYKVADSKLKEFFAGLSAV
jgi:hypothetical protein